MKVYTGSNITYMYDTLIKECINKTREQPLASSIWIVPDPVFLEEAFLKHTNALFNIDICTFDTFVQSLIKHSSKQVLSSLDAYILLYRCLQESPSFLCQNPSDFKQLSSLLSIFETFNGNGIEDVPKGDKKLVECYRIYQSFVKQIPDGYEYFPLLLAKEQIHTITNTTIYINEQCIKDDSYLVFLKEVSKQNDVFVIAPFTNEEKEAYRYHQYRFDKLPQIEITSNHPSTLLDSIFTNQNVETDNQFYQLIESNPLAEIKSVCYHLYQSIVEDGAKYSDFMLYYPNVQYLEILLEVLDDFHIPYNGIPQVLENKVYRVCQLLLQYALTNDETCFIALLDTLQIKQCTSPNIIDYYKKQWYQHRSINIDSYLELKQHIDTYVTILQNSSTIQEISSCLHGFIKEELVYDEQHSSWFTYLSKLIDTNLEISLSTFISLLEETYPNQRATQTTMQDHVYLCQYHQSYAGILQKDRIYFLGVNEGLVPSQMNNTGLLLENDYQQLDMHPTIADYSSMQQNQWLQLLSVDNSNIIMSYALSSLSGETLLPSSYLLGLKNQVSFTTIDPSHLHSHPAVIERWYQQNGEDSNFITLNTLIHQYKQRKNQPNNIHAKFFKDTLSISQLETYNACPYKYFMQYGMQLQPWKEPILQANEIGTLVHYVLECNSDLFHSATQAKDVNPKELSNVIEHTIQQYMEEHPNFKRKQVHPYNRYFIENITLDLVTTLLVLIEQKKASSFKVLETEKRVFQEYDSFQIQGVIDRLDAFKDFIAVMDYKSSEKELDLSLALQGFNIQMLVYMDIVSKQLQLDKAGLVYFNTKKRILKSSLPITIQEEAKNFFKEYKMQGYVNEHSVEFFDGDIEGFSDIIKVRYVKTKDTYTGNILSSTMFERLIEHIMKHVQLLHQQMLQGDIRIHPKGSLDQSIHTKVHPCTYCSYRSICTYDIFYNEMDLVSSIDVEKIVGGEDNE